MRKYSELNSAQRPLVFNAIPELTYPHRLNAARTLVEGAIEQGWQDRTAYVHAGATTTFADLRRAVHRYAAALRDLGVQRGDAVLIRIEDRPELIYALLATQAIGAVAIPTYVQLRSDDLAYRADDASARVVLVSETLLKEAETLADRCASVDHVVVVPQTADKRFLSLDRLLPADAPAFEYEDTEADEVALLLYTSGSTGRPKGTMHSHSDLLAVCDTYCRYCVGLREGDVIGGPAAVPFALGYGFFALFPLRFGVAAILQPDKAPEAMVPVLRQNGVTVLVAVPTYYQALCKVLENGGLGLDRLRLALVGGEPLPNQVEQRWEAATGLPLHQFLGTTELLHIFISTRADQDRPRTGAIGIAVPGYEISVRHPDTFKPLDVGEHGLLCVRGATGTRYWNRPEAQEAAVRDGWSVFQDIVWRDADGFIHYVARHDDVIVSAGYVISPVDVETVLLSHPNIVECACVAAPDPRAQRSSIVKAFIVLKDAAPDDVLKKEIQAFFKGKAPPYMYPREIAFLEELPKTLNGKILRSELRRLA